MDENAKPIIDIDLDEPDSTAAPATEQMSELDAVDAAKLIDSLIHYTNEHAIAAAEGRPDQPTLLLARRLISQQIQRNNDVAIALAIRDENYLDVVKADTEHLESNEAYQRATDLISPEERNVLGDPIAFYLHGKPIHARLSNPAAADWKNAAAINIVLQQHAKTIAAERIFELAMINPTMARMCLADAGVASELITLDAISRENPRAAAYIAADRAAVDAIARGDWTAYGAASRTRLLAMNAMYGNPTALVALGMMTSQERPEIANKAASDLALVRAHREKGGMDVLDKDLQKLEASFLNDFKLNGADPVKRYAEIQNVLKAQETLSPENKVNIAYLQKISEKTALELTANIDNLKRIKVEHPSLMTKLAFDADKKRESALTLGKETTMVRTMDGRIVGNDAADQRNKGATSREVAKVAPSAAHIDRQSADKIGQSQAQADQMKRSLSANPDMRVITSKEQQVGQRQGTQPALTAGTPDFDKITKAEAEILSPKDWDAALRAKAGEQPKPGEAPKAVTPNTQKTAASDHHAKAPLAKKHEKAMQHKNSNPEFDKDDGPFQFDPRNPNLDFRGLVNARTPYSVEALKGQLNDPRKLIFAVPLNNFSNLHAGKIIKGLTEIANNDPERFFKMYQATRKTWNAWANGPRLSDGGKTSLDSLEIGRRIMAEVGLRTGRLKPEKISHHIRPIKSHEGQALSPAQRWDLGDFMQKGDLKGYVRVAARSALNKRIRSAANWAKTKTAGFSKEVGAPLVTESKKIAKGTISTIVDLVT